MRRMRVSRPSEGFSPGWHAHGGACFLLGKASRVRGEGGGGSHARSKRGDRSSPPSVGPSLSTRSLKEIARRGSLGWGRPRSKGSARAMEAEWLASRCGVNWRPRGDGQLNEGAGEGRGAPGPGAHSTELLPVRRCGGPEAGGRAGRAGPFVGSGSTQTPGTLSSRFPAGLAPPGEPSAASEGGRLSEKGLSKQGTRARAVAAGESGVEWPAPRADSRPKPTSPPARRLPGPPKHRRGANRPRRSLGRPTTTKTDREHERDPPALRRRSGSGDERE